MVCMAGDVTASTHTSTGGVDADFFSLKEERLEIELLQAVKNKTIRKHSQHAYGIIEREGWEPTSLIRFG